MSPSLSDSGPIARAADGLPNVLLRSAMRLITWYSFADTWSQLEVRQTPFWGSPGSSSRPSLASCPESGTTPRYPLRLLLPPPPT